MIAYIAHTLGIAVVVCGGVAATTVWVLNLLRIQKLRAELAELKKASDPEILKPTLEQIEKYGRKISAFQGSSFIVFVLAFLLSGATLLLRNPNPTALDPEIEARLQELRKHTQVLKEIQGTYLDDLRVQLQELEARGADANDLRAELQIQAERNAELDELWRLLQASEGGMIL